MLAQSLRPHTLMATVLILALAGCGGADAMAGQEKPITLTQIDGEDIWRLELSARAADRLDIQVGSVEQAGDTLAVPRAAVIIDPVGVYWVYTNPEPLVYVRHELRNVREENGQAYFEDGPPIGTAVVTTGVPELYGAEVGIGK